MKEINTSMKFLRVDEEKCVPSTQVETLKIFSHGYFFMH